MIINARTIWKSTAILWIIYALVPLLFVLPATLRYCYITIVILSCFILLLISSRVYAIIEGLLCLGMHIFLYILVWREKANFIIYLMNSTMFWVPLLLALSHNYIFRFDTYCVDENHLLTLIKILNIITSITTIIGCMKYPNASRYLATGVKYYTDIYSRENIGGYGFIYCIVFFTPVYYYLMRKKRDKLSAICLIVNTICIVVSQYTIGILFTAMFILTSAFVLNKGTKNKVIKLSGIAIIIGLTYMFFDRIIETVITFLDSNNFFQTADRIRLLVQFLKGNALDGDALGRYELYKISVNSFLENPFFGGMFRKVNIGWHSEILDLLACGGLFLFSFFVCIFMIWRTHINQYRFLPPYNYYMITLIGWLVFACINPTFTTSIISLSIFLFPVLLFEIERKDY